MSMTIERDQIEQIIDVMGGVDIMEDCSGRGMYGETCLAFHGEVNLMEFGALAGDVLGFEAACRLASMAQTDSLGRGTVLYFPGVTVENKDVDEEASLALY